MFSHFLPRFDYIIKLEKDKNYFAIKTRFKTDAIRLTGSMN